MARIVICEDVTGTGTFTGFGGGKQNIMQIHSTGAFSATLSASILNNGQFATLLTATANDFYLFDTLTDANYKLVVTSNSGTLTAVVA